MNELALFSGIGGGILGGKLLGWKTVCAVEIDEYARSVLLARQNDGTLEPFPIWDNVRTFDGIPWRGIVDVVSGGFPCQDISVAGKQAGIAGERSGLWKEMARIVGEIRPAYVFVENVPNLINRGIETVLGDLAAMGYDSRWGIVSAENIGAPHKRKRIWIVAHSNSVWKSQSQGCQSEQRERVGDSGHDVSDSDKARLQGWCGLGQPETEWQKPTGIRYDASGYGGAKWWQSEPGMGRVVNGCSYRMDRLKSLGNAQVPLQAATAFIILSGMEG